MGVRTCLFAAEAVKLPEIRPGAKPFVDRAEGAASPGTEVPRAGLRGGQSVGRCELAPVQGPVAELTLGVVHAVDHGPTRSRELCDAGVVAKLLARAGLEGGDVGRLMHPRAPRVVGDPSADVGR